MNKILKLQVTTLDENGFRKDTSEWKPNKGYEPVFDSDDELRDTVAWAIHTYLRYTGWMQKLHAPREERVFRVSTKQGVAFI